MTAFLMLCCWMGFLPLGYIACRWANRAMGLKKWTRLDRLGAIFISLFWGPFMPIFAVVVVLVDKLSESKWANRDAGW